MLLPALTALSRPIPLQQHRAAVIYLSKDEEPLLIRCDGSWYDLSFFRHPGGSEVLERHAGTDITHLFNSNHFEPDTSPIERFKIDDHADESAKSEISPQYAELKLEVHEHLKKNKIEWRHNFQYYPYALRLFCLLACYLSRRCAAAQLGGLANALGFAAAAAYGLLTGRQTWTHAHNGVHNPQRISRAMRMLIHVDFVGVIDVWLAEHHAHHAHTNGKGDPDMRWWRPLFSYADLAATGGSRRTRLLAACAYPFLVPVMLTRSLGHAARHDPRGMRTLAWVVAVAPFRFGLDVALMGPRLFSAALSCATLYILMTFVATHQVASNHAFEPGDCWMARQYRATNNVWSSSPAWSFFCGGINNHIEHHLFPQVRSVRMPHPPLIFGCRQHVTSAVTSVTCTISSFRSPATRCRRSRRLSRPMRKGTACRTAASRRGSSPKSTLPSSRHSQLRRWRTKVGTLCRAEPSYYARYALPALTTDEPRKEASTLSTVRYRWKKSRAVALLRVRPEGRSQGGGSAVTKTLRTKSPLLECL